ncbi:hypothetical protein AHF37_10766 [Paragonimus kellicotti]|nr:hypothetical protein AHF37_10766 [Paragonimus kellicotti]
MTQLTFSNTEVFLMLIISTALAVFGGVNFILLLAATSRSTKCPVSEFYGPEPSWKERIGLAIFCALCKIALMIQSIVLRMRYRFSHEYMRLRQSMKSSRLSVATSNFSRKMSSMLKNSYRQAALPPLTEGQKTLIRLLTKTTIDRIVEAAERDLEVKREQRRVLIEENRRRLHEAGEVEAEAHEAELAAEAAKREAETAALQVADAKDGKAKTAATQKAEQAKVQAKLLAQRAASLREFATKRMSVMRDMMSEREELEDDTADMPWLSMSDRKALHHAAPELRAYLQLPRYHTPEYFLLHPEMQHQAELRTTVHPAPERDSRQEG